MNVTRQRISIPSQSCLQCRQWPLTSTEIDPPRVWIRDGIRVVNGRPFLCCSIVWRQTFWIGYRTLFEELVSENKCLFAMPFSIEKTLMCLVLKIYLFPILHLLIKCLVTKLRMNRNVSSGVVLVPSQPWLGSSSIQRCLQKFTGGDYKCF